MSASDSTGERGTHYVPLRFENFRAFLDAYSSRISEDGMFVETREPLPVGTRVQLDVRLSDEFRLLEGAGEVVWTVDEDTGEDWVPGMAIRFVDLDEPGRRLAARLVDNHVKQGGTPFSLAALPQLAAGLPAPEAPRVERAPGVSARTEPAAAAPSEEKTGPTPDAPLEVPAAEIPAEPPTLDPGPPRRTAPKAPADTPPATPEAAPVAGPEPEAPRSPEPLEPSGASEPPEPPNLPERDAETAEGSASAAPEAEPPGPAGTPESAAASADEPPAAPAPPERPGPATSAVASPPALDGELLEVPELPGIDHPGEEPAEVAPPAPSAGVETGPPSSPPAEPAPPPISPAEPPAPPDVTVQPPSPPSPAPSPPPPAPLGVEPQQENGTAVSYPLAGSASVPAGPRWLRPVLLGALLIVAAGAAGYFLGGEELRSRFGFGSEEAVPGEPALVSPQDAPVAGPAAGASGAEAAEADAAAIGAEEEVPTAGEPPGPAGGLTPRAGGAGAPAAPAEEAGPPAAPDSVASAEAPASLAPPPVVLAPMTAIRDLRWERRPGTTVLVLVADGRVDPASVSSFRLGGPTPRAVLKVAGVAEPFARQTVTVGTPEVRRVRTGLHDVGGVSELHFVADLAAPAVAAGEPEVAGNEIRLPFSSAAAAR